MINVTVGITKSVDNDNKIMERLKYNIKGLSDIKREPKGELDPASWSQ